MNIELKSLLLTRYNPDKHQVLKEELESGKPHSDFIYQVGERLETSKDNDRTIYQSAFVVEDLGTPVGYLFISSMVRDEIFLEYAVLKEERGKGYVVTLLEKQPTTYSKIIILEVLGWILIQAIKAVLMQLKQRGIQ